MDLRTKLAALYGIFIVSSLIIGIMIVYLHEYFIIVLVVNTLAIGCLVMSIRCPKCKKPVTKNKMELFGIEFTIWTPTVPDKCSQCGTELK